MYTKYLMWDNHSVASRKLGFPVSRNVEAPGLDEIERAIREMNGGTRDLVILANKRLTGEDRDEHSMTVAGGLDDVYNCSTYSGKDGATYVLVDPTKSSERTVPIMDGQPDSILECHSVALGVVLKAVKMFAEEGALDPSLNWEQIQ